MPNKMTWEWLEPRLAGLNAKWLEENAQLTKGRIADARRGKVTLSQDELDRIKEVMLYFR